MPLLAPYFFFFFFVAFFFTIRVTPLPIPARPAVDYVGTLGDGQKGVKDKIPDEGGSDGTGPHI